MCVGWRGARACGWVGERGDGVRVGMGCGRRVTPPPTATTHTHTHKPTHPPAGTPLQNNLSEFYAMVSFCCPDALGTLAQFERVRARCWCCCLLVLVLLPAGACCWCLLLVLLPAASGLLALPPPPPSPRRPPRPPLTPSPPPLGAGLRSADRARQGPGGQARGGGAGGGALQVRGAGVVACEFCACGGGGECVGQSPRRWSLSTCAPPHVPTQGAGAAGGLVRAAAHRRDQRALSPPPPPLRRLLPPLPRAAARVQRRWVWGGWVGRGDGWVDGWVG